MESFKELEEVIIGKTNLYFTGKSFTLFPALSCSLSTQTKTLFNTALAEDLARGSTQAGGGCPLHIMKLANVSNDF
jgi:hypothetical protein